MKEKKYDQSRYYQPGAIHYRDTPQNFVMGKDGILRDVAKEKDESELKPEAEAEKLSES